MYSHFKGRFIQVIESLDMNDACSNHVVHIDAFVKKKYRIKTAIYAKHVHPSRAHLINFIDYLEPSDDDIIFFHFSGYSEYCASKVISANGLKILHYHNITPHYFFEKNTILYNLCKKGHQQLKEIIGYFQFATADSNYNLNEIISLGFDEKRTQKLPIILDELPEKRQAVNSEENNIIFVGRICENKCQHKLIEFYHGYAKTNKIGKLFLVGKYDTSSSYYKKIVRLIHTLNLEGHVFLTGPVSESQLEEYYTNSQCLISFSEHEGFGVPLLEAAQYNIPVLALNKAAVSETLEMSSGLFNTDSELTLMLQRLFSNSEYKKSILNHQQNVLANNTLDAWGEYADKLFKRLLPDKERFQTISLVICTYNRGDYLDRCLDYLSKSYSDAFEVIVVNGPSTDNTNDVLSRWQDKIKIRSNPERNLSRSRNIGIEAAAGDLIAFIDDDAIPFLDWFDRIVNYYITSHNFVAGAGGPTYYAGTLQFQAVDIFVDNFGSGIVNPGKGIKEDPDYRRSLLGTNSVFRRDYLVEAGGFDEEYDYFLDETDVCFRLINNGYLINHCPDAYLRHEFAQSENRKNKYDYNWYSIVKNTVYFALTYTKGDKQEIIDELKAVIERERIDYLNSGLSNKEISKSDYDDLVKSVWSGFDAGLEAIQKETKLLNSNTIKDASFAKFNEVKIANVPKHIVIVTKEFPPFTRSGGIGTLYYNLASELLLAGHFVTIIMQSDKVETIENGRFRLIALTKDVGSETYIDDSLIANEILNWSKRIAIEIDALNEIHPVSVVDSCLWDSEAYAFSLINKELNIPLVIRLVTPFLVANETNQWNMSSNDINYLTNFERKLVENATAVVPISDSIKKTFINKYQPSSEVEYHKINAGIAYWPKYDVASGYKELGTNLSYISEIIEDKKVFLYMGRVELRKGIDVFLDAINVINSQNNMKDVIFLIAGSDTIGIHGMIKERVSNPENIYYIGEVSDSEREKLYSICDVVVFPSRYESFGLVPLEAFVHAKPVIASNAGAIPEVVIDNDSGLIFNDGSAEDLASRIEQLIQKPDLYSKLSLGASKRVRELSSYQSAAQSIKLYNSIG